MVVGALVVAAVVVKGWDRRVGGRQVWILARTLQDEGQGGDGPTDPKDKKHHHSHNH